MKHFSMKKVIVLAICLLMITACSAGNSQSSGDGKEGGGKEPERHMFSLLTTDSSSSFYAFFVGATNAISSQYPELQITVTETGGATDNIERLAKGESTFSLGVSVSDYKAFNGLDGFEKNDSLRALWYFDQSAFNFVVNKDSGVKTLENLKNADFSMGGSGTTTEKSIQEIFEVLGIETNHYNGSMLDAQNAFSDRRIDGLTKAGSPPDSYVQQVAAQVDINLLGITEEQAELIKEKLPYYGMATTPAGSYKGVDKDVLTPMFMLGALLDSSVSQEVGYKMWKAIWSEQGKNIWGNSYPAGKDANLPELTLNSPIPLHAGAVQYLKEIGVEVPENLIPEEYVEVK